MQILTERIGLQIEPEIKEKAQIQAEKNGTTLSLAIRAFLREYGKDVDLVKEKKK